MTKARRIGLVGFPRLTTLDLTGPHEVFATANALNDGRKRLSRAELWWCSFTG